MALWFLFGLGITTMLSLYAPGYPIVVGTPSITPGIYWLDRTDATYRVNDFVSFPFVPAQDWLLQRYGTNRFFTKEVKAVAGDTVFADEAQRVRVCHAVVREGSPSCEDLGVALKQDTIGRPLTAWIPAKHQYTLRSGELWVHAPSLLSLDSRYYGPIQIASVQGKASPLVLWK